MAALTLDVIKHSWATATNRQQKLHTGLQTPWILRLSIFPPDLRMKCRIQTHQPLDYTAQQLHMQTWSQTCWSSNGRSEWGRKGTVMTFIWKEDHRATLLFFFLEMFLTSSLVQEWLDNRNTRASAPFWRWLCMVAEYCNTSLNSVHSFWSSPKFLSQLYLTVLLGFGCPCFPSSQLLYQCSPLITAHLFVNAILWFIPLVEGVDDHHLVNCQVSRLPYEPEKVFTVFILY